VASLPAVEQAVGGLVDRLAEVDPQVRARFLIARTVSCRVPDLDVMFVGNLDDDGLRDLRKEDPADRAQVRLTVSSDDLLALAEGRLAVPSAFATGRLKVVASPLDLLKLRSLL